MCRLMTFETQFHIDIKNWLGDVWIHINVLFLIKPWIDVGAPCKFIGIFYATTTNLPHDVPIVYYLI
jgi:hypothetical protein